MCTFDDLALNTTPLWGFLASSGFSLWGADRLAAVFLVIAIIAIPLVLLNLVDVNSHRRSAGRGGQTV